MTPLSTPRVSPAHSGERVIQKPPESSSPRVQLHRWHQTPQEPGPVYFSSPCSYHSTSCPSKMELLPSSPGAGLGPCTSCWLPFGSHLPLCPGILPAPLHVQSPLTATLPASLTTPQTPRWLLLLCLPLNLDSPRGPDSVLPQSVFSLQVSAAAFDKRDPHAGILS